MMSDDNRARSSIFLPGNLFFSIFARKITWTDEVRNGKGDVENFDDDEYIFTTSLEIFFFFTSTKKRPIQVTCLFTYRK